MEGVSLDENGGIEVGKRWGAREIHGGSSNRQSVESQEASLK